VLQPAARKTRIRAATCAAEHRRAGGQTRCSALAASRRRDRADPGRTGRRDVPVGAGSAPADAPRRPRRTRLDRLLTSEDRRGLTPLFWQHVLPYGEVKLDMTARLSIRTAAPVSGADPAMRQVDLVEDDQREARLDATDQLVLLDCSAASEIGKPMDDDVVCPA